MSAESMPTTTWQTAVHIALTKDRAAVITAMRALNVEAADRAAIGLVALASAAESSDVASLLLAESPYPEGGLVAVSEAVTHHGDIRWLRASWLFRLGAQSHYLGILAARRPEVLDLLVASDLHTARASETMLELTQSALVAEDSASSLANLRRLRDAELTRAFTREALGLASGAETTAEISALAAACLQTALDIEIQNRPESTRPVYEDKDGRTVPIPFVIIGLGKLGGWELNFGSDVDIVYVYGTDQGWIPDGGGRWAIHEYFARLARDLTRSVDQNSADGRLWRVDLRLRPDGSKGPLVHGLSALESYYEAWGGTFERAVWLKARAVAGDDALGREVLARLRPFVFPKSLDYSALDGLRDMKQRIDRHAVSLAHTTPALLRKRNRGAVPDHWPEGSASVLGWDVKVGVGGIREIEFTIQALQLVYGGRQPELQGPNTLQTLERLLAAGLLPSRDVETLASTYAWYRLIEHRVQMDMGRHTHALPETTETMERLARRLGFEPFAFLERLLEARAQIAALFARLLAAPSDDDASPWSPALMRVVEREHLSNDDPELYALLAELGFERPRQSAGQLMVLQSKRYSPFSPLAPARIKADAPRLLNAVCQSADPDLALLHTTTFILGIGHHHAYYSTLRRSQAALTMLMSVFGASRYLSRLFVRDPQWFDELLGATPLVSNWNSAALGEACAVLLEGLGDTEKRLSALRRFKHRGELQIARADIAGLIDAEEVCRRLTLLADVTVSAVLAEAIEELEAKFGTPRHADTDDRAGFVILALGKLGGHELSYGSDLDVVFVYSGVGQTDGDRVLSNREYFSRLGRRVIAFVTTKLATGQLYAIDTRLRPSGRQGTLVVSHRAFESYHTTQATVWEHQALIKARVVAGDPDLGASLEALARQMAFEQDHGTSQEVRAKVVELRCRLEDQFASQDGSFYNLKAGVGGLLDIEFATQACQLVWGHTLEGLQTPSTLHALRALAKTGRLETHHAEVLTRGYITLRRIELRLRMLEGTGTSKVPIGDVGEMRRLARRMGYRRAEPGRALVQELERTVRDVRATYQAVMQGVAQQGEETR